MTRKYQFGIWLANKVQNSNLWPPEDYTNIEATIRHAATYILCGITVVVETLLHEATV